MDMRLVIKLFVVSLCFLSIKIYSQATCTGSYTTTNASCQQFTVGNGTSGAIVLCLTANNIPGGGGSSCNPGGSCNPPFSGGGWVPRISIFTSTGTLVTTWTSATPVGTCYTLSPTNGYAVIYGLCLTAGTSFSWTTVNQCGNPICSGAVACAGQPCATCASACAACGFATNPSVATVTSSCPPNNLPIPFGSSQNYTMCASFTAATTTVNFNAIIQSNCGAGNVSNFSWTLQNAACGGTLQSGTLASLTFTGLTVGTTYVFCYSFTVPTGYCQHTIHWPYFVGAAPLPIDLVSFKAYLVNDKVFVKWITASESKNEYFIIERSKDAANYEAIGKVDGAINSSQMITYNFVDENPLQGISYYRLKQVDLNGDSKVTNPEVVNASLFSGEEFSLVPNPASEDVTVNFISSESTNETIYIYDSNGLIKLSKDVNCNAGVNATRLDISELGKGLYFVLLNIDGKIFKSKLVIN